MSVKYTSSFLALAVIAVLACAQVSASVINMSKTTTLFYDDFEGPEVVSGATYPDLSGSYNPTATVGTWTIREAYPQSIQVTDSTTAPDPGTLQGSKYLRLLRQSYEAGESGQAVAGFTALQSKSGDRIRIQEMVYIGSAAEITPFYMTAMGSGDRYAIGVFANGNAANGSIDYYAPDGNVNATGLSFTAGVWQKWQIDYNIGTPTMSLSIDDGTPVSLAVHSDGDLQYVILAKGPLQGSSCYVDEVAVPEPTSVVLLLTGLLGLVAYAWRKQR